MSKDTEIETEITRTEEIADDEFIVIRKTHLLAALLPIALVLGIAIGVAAGVMIGTVLAGQTIARATDADSLTDVALALQDIAQHMEEASDSSNLAIAVQALTEVVQQMGGTVPAPQPVEQAEAPAEPTRIEVSPDDDPSIGPEDAPVVIVEFSDFQCPYCTRFQAQTLYQLLEEYGDQIRFVYRDFPLTAMHSQALPAAEAAECANEQGYFWEMHDILFENQSQLDTDSLRRYAESLGLDMNAFNECLDTGRYRDEVMADLTDGQTYGVRGTPTFFINGSPLVGAQPIEAFRALIDQELAEEGE